MIEPPNPEEDPSAKEVALQAEMEAFMDELTTLTRRTCIVVSSNGDIDVTSLRKVSQEEANRGRYVFFWEHLRYHYPVDMFWEPGEDDPSHLVDM